MFNSVAIDAAIGMAFIYLLLSLIASVVQEILASIVQARAANLQRGLRSMFSGDSIEAGKTLVDSIYNHGLVRGLYQDPKKDYGSQAGASKVRLLLQRLVGIAPAIPIKGVSDPILLPAYIPARTFALAMIDLLNNDKANGEPVDNIRKFLTTTDQNVPSNKAIEALRALVIDADGDMNRLRTNLENWYSDAMDRVSGWYKKYTQTVLLVIGLLLAIAFNVDSVRVARTLWTDKDARQGMVDAANEYMKNPKPEDKDKKLQQRMRDAVDAFDHVTKDQLLPVGWQRTPSEYWLSGKTYWLHRKTMKSPLTKSRIFKGVELLVGWLITAAAISLGAPFWFDTLNKFMVVRGTVKPQEKSEPVGSKDKEQPETAKDKQPPGAGPTP